jgi:hypothetical protein
MMSQSQFPNVEDNKSHRKSFHSHQHHDHVVVMLKHYLNPKDIVGHTFSTTVLCSFHGTTPCVRLHILSLSLDPNPSHKASYFPCCRISSFNYMPSLVGTIFFSDGANEDRIYVLCILFKFFTIIKNCLEI